MYSPYEHPRHNKMYLPSCYPAVGEHREAILQGTLTAVSVYVQDSACLSLCQFPVFSQIYKVPGIKWILFIGVFGAEDPERLQGTYSPIENSDNPPLQETKKNAKKLLNAPPSPRRPKRSLSPSPTSPFQPHTHISSPQFQTAFSPPPPCPPLPSSIPPLLPSLLLLPHFSSPFHYYFSPLSLPSLQTLFALPPSPAAAPEPAQPPSMGPPQQESGA
ncbi:hypothetical protein L211DRAFT_484234 [Terfezia boudieri ATCC MYA-4762]|uniref:Uncharacterized protein n=1 Tax=Terfezia boudieri ATCC MYA-4762 TaxID=1051890 RepID=A0A3N4M2B0_9PEZI|nr:hypothetical protein L211DRAFT_484234 [Terfezia boudieri ATCC MYA-4762]